MNNTNTKIQLIIQIFIFFLLVYIMLLAKDGFTERAEILNQTKDFHNSGCCFGSKCILAASSTF